MSSYFGQIRRKKSLEQYINELSQRLAIYQATQNRVEDEQFKSVQRAKNYKLILRETASAQTGAIINPGGGGPIVVVPTEPDGSTVTMMLNFDHGLEDSSTFGNHAFHEYTNNQVLFVEGKAQTFGFALDFNPTSNLTYDKIWISFSKSTEMVYNRTTGFSVFASIYVYNLSAASGAQKWCIWQKMDDLDNAAQARIGTDGVIHFIVRKNGTEYKVKSAAQAFNTWLDCWFVFNGTSTVTLYVNNVQYTTASTDVLAWNNTHSHFIIGNYNLGRTAALANASFRGKIDEIRLYRAPVSTTQVNNFDTNGFTITDVGEPNAPIPPGTTSMPKVFIVNRVLIDSREHTQETYVANNVVMSDVLTDEGAIALFSYSENSYSPISYTVLGGSSPLGPSFTTGSFTSGSFTTA